MMMLVMLKKQLKYQQTAAQQTIKNRISWCKIFDVAYIRAMRGYNKLKYQRVSIETETTMDGRLLFAKSTY